MTADDRIGVGANWEEDINAALNESGVAVLLLSPSFLASGYIWDKDKEIDRIHRHWEDGMAVLPLVVRPCAWRLESWLSSLQVRPADGRALSIGDDAQVDLDLSAFVYELAALVGRFPSVDAASERAIANEHVSLTASLAGFRRDRPLTRSLASPELTAAAPETWSGQYNQDYRIDLTIESWNGDQFIGSIDYVGSGTVTEVSGRRRDADIAGITARVRQFHPGALPFDKDPAIAIMFGNESIRTSGRRTTIDPGRYEAVISDDTMWGAWINQRGSGGARFTLRRRKSDD